MQVNSSVCRGSVGGAGDVRYRVRVIECSKDGWIVDIVKGAVPGGNTVPLRLLSHSIGIRCTTHIAFHFDLSSLQYFIFSREFEYHLCLKLVYDE